jgi:hypothetical protein
MPRIYKHKDRGKTMRYDPLDLKRAVDMVRTGELSIRKAAQTFAIPKSTIADRISGKHPDDVGHGRPPSIPPDVENKIVQSVKVAAQQGMGITRKQLLLRTAVLCKKLKIKRDEKPFTPGKDWWEGVKNMSW